MATGIFEGFETVTLPAGATEVVFGVNVFQVQASVLTAETGTVAELIEKYRAQLGLPEGVEVFVDGVKLSSDARIPANCQRVEIMKPAGTKGIGSLLVPNLPLTDKDAVMIVITREDTVEYIRWILDGAIDIKLMPYITLIGNRHLINEHGAYYIGHPVVAATRKSLRSPETVIYRRVAGGIAPTAPLTVNTVRDSQTERVVRTILNGETFTGSRKLEVGETLIVVLPGKTSQEDFVQWVHDQTSKAVNAYAEYESAREVKTQPRITKLEAMNWLKLRAIAVKSGVKATGKGRTSAAIIADLLNKEFPKDDCQEFTNAWLAENAPEALTFTSPTSKEERRAELNAWPYNFRDLGDLVIRYGGRSALMGKDEMIEFILKHEGYA